ncbi:hypothetical protein PSAC2689_80318 [Paraburkholderia sacchari]
MARRLDAVEVVIPDRVIFPAHWVVQRVHARIAPMSIEVVFGKRGFAAPQFEQLAGGQQRNLGRRNLRFAHGNRRLRHSFLVGLAFRDIDETPRAFQQRLGCVNPPRDIADLRDRERVLGGALDAAIDPRARLVLHELDRVRERRARDAEIDRRRRDLRKRACKCRPIVGALRMKDFKGAHANVFRNHGAARRRALAEAAPVVHHRKPRRALLHEGQYRLVLLVEREHRNPVREHRSCRIKLATVEHEAVAVAANTGLDVEHVFAARFRKRIAVARALEHQIEEEALLGLSAFETDVFDQAKVVLRNLSDRRIGLGDDRNNLGKRDTGHFRAAIRLRNGDGPEPARGKEFDFIVGQLARAIALRRIFLELYGDGARNGKRFFVRANDGPLAVGSQLAVEFDGFRIHIIPAYAPRLP